MTRTPQVVDRADRSQDRVYFFQAEDGIRDIGVTGVQTCALPIFISQRRSVGMTASAWRTSAGAAARLPVARAVNLARALGSYQDAGLVTVGLAGDGDVDLHDFDGFADPLAMVVGAEGAGLSRLVRGD